MADHFNKNLEDHLDTSQKSFDPEEGDLTESQVMTKPKKVSRAVPILFDIIILGIQLTIFGSYFYMTFIHGDLEEPACKTDMNSEVPI